MKHTLFKNLEHIWQNTYRFNILGVPLPIRLFESCWKIIYFQPSLALSGIKLSNIYEFSLIILHSRAAKSNQCSNYDRGIRIHASFL